MRARKEKTAVWQVIRPILWGVGSGVALCTALLLIASALMAAGLIPSSWTTPLAVAVAVVSAFLGGFISANSSKTHGWLFGMIVGLLLCALLILVGVSLGNPNGGGLLLKTVLTVAGGAAGGVLGVNAKKR